MFLEIATTYQKNCKKRFHDHPFFPAGSNRDAWNSLPDTIKVSLGQAGKLYNSSSYPVILAADYMNFVETGNRTIFEEMYFDRRRILNTFILAECVSWDGGYLTDIINGIFLICEESAWQLPAHNAYLRDTPQFILPDKEHPILDLFACETGALLAMILSLLKEPLLKKSPLIIKRIEAELLERIITPYLNHHFWWMGNGQEQVNNWTVWCTQNILITAFSLNLDEQLKAQVFLKAAQSIDYFLAEYQEDGCCDEGAGYYRHAGLCLFNAIELLNHITDGYFASIYEEEKIKNIAAYIQKVHVTDKYYINFADCSPVAGRCGAREFLFGKRTKQLNLMGFAAKDYLAGDANFLLKEEINLFYRLQALFTHQELLDFPSEMPLAYNDSYFASTGLFITRDDTFTLAVKAGDNDDSHNHNDTGSFTIYKNGLPLFIDVGVESYQQKTFSPQRYEIWTMQSSYHNLPEFDGLMEVNGAEYQATDVRWHFNDKLAEIEMELKYAYPAETGLASYHRKVSFVKGQHILIEDSKKGRDNKWILNLITYEKPEMTEHILKIGSLATVLIEGFDEIATIEAIPITDSRLQTAWKHDIFRVRLLAKTDKIRLIIQ